MDDLDDLTARIGAILRRSDPSPTLRELQARLARALAFEARIEDGDHAANDTDGAGGHVQNETPITQTPLMAPRFCPNWRADYRRSKSLCSKSFPPHPVSSRCLDSGTSPQVSRTPC